ncbi:hypothetical protein GCM10010172_56290 [Paractinoplanes ferrugineus]|uniref:Uncharacterized protein n=1 Tax=Paractinoplanes ferrugineus TaxID=113564 RepID=A0A919IXZ1_9ACTN|nr:hypothetical protein Afe05nite_27400 [Actinoplanes ferrugineus]
MDSDGSHRPPAMGSHRRMTLSVGRVQWGPSMPSFNVREMLPPLLTDYKWLDYQSVTQVTGFP